MDASRPGGWRCKRPASSTRNQAVAYDAQTLAAIHEELASLARTRPGTRVIFTDTGRVEAAYEALCALVGGPVG